MRRNLRCGRTRMCLDHRHLTDSSSKRLRVRRGTWNQIRGTFLVQTENRLTPKRVRHLPGCRNEQYLGIIELIRRLASIALAILQPANKPAIHRFPRWLGPSVTTRPDVPSDSVLRAIERVPLAHLLICLA